MTDDWKQLDVRHLAEHFDRTIRGGQLLEEGGGILEAAHGLGQQPVEPAGIFGFGLSHVAQAHLEVFAIGVHGTHHHFVSKDKFQIDSVSRNLDHAIAAGHAGKYQEAILAKALHTCEDDPGVAGRFEDQIEWPDFFSTFYDRYFLGYQIPRP